LIVRATVERPLETEPELDAWLRGLISGIDMKIMAGPMFAYAEEPINKGWTGIAVIEFSHVSMHIWEKESPPLIELDVFSCREFDINAVVDRVRPMGILGLSIYYINRDNFNGNLDKFWTFYKTTNTENGKVYYGVHGAPHIDSSYIGSGKVLKQAIRKHGRKAFKTEHLRFFFTEAEAYAYEAAFITEQHLSDPDCYNIGRGGGGGHKTLRDLVWITDGTINKFVDRAEAERSYIGRGWEYGRTIPDTVKEKMRGKPSPFRGKKRPALSRAMKGRRLTDEWRENVKKAHWLNNGGKISNDTRQKMSEAHKVVAQKRKRNGRGRFEKGAPDA
jgi:hypothetical protein